ncbi:S9 family peptidase [Elongatibacter sediminis]|uniref:S9 family peptidase n=1 Tax=Elongatibacter sediminis TaxID=3119006 RepID=A0AAW9R6R1_9GAMM
MPADVAQTSASGDHEAMRHALMLTTLCLLALSVEAAEHSGRDTGYTERRMNDGQLILQDVPEIPPRLVERLRQYQAVRSATFLDWARDGEGLYVLTRFADLSQVHRVRFAGGTRQQLTYLPDPIIEVHRQPGGDRLALTTDPGGSEFSQIYRFDPDTAETVLLSDGASRNARLVWSRDGSRLAFQSTRRNGRSNDIWIMDPLRPDSAIPVLASLDDTWWGPAGFTPDGRGLLAQQLIGATDSRIHLIDLQSGEQRRVAGDPEFPSANRASVVDRKGKGFYMISNARGLAAELAWQPFEPGAETEFISTSTPWDVMEFALSEDGRRGAFTTNEEGMSRLYLLNTRTGRYSLVGNMPVGLIYGLKFHPDNRQLAMTLNAAHTPSDVFVMQLGRRPEAARALHRWTFSEVGGLDTERFARPQLIRYPTFDFAAEDQPRRIPAFVYRPDGAGPHPVIIHIHGGPEGQYRPAFSSLFQSWISELGAAVIAPNVRGSFGYGNEWLALDDGRKREDAVRDIGALLDWIRNQPDLDENRVAVYGGSYGGYMALASAVHFGDRLRAAVDVVGISNFVTFLEHTQDYRRDLRRREYGDERDPEMRAFLESISPLNHADRIDVPLLVVQGQNDPRVPPSESEQIVTALRARGRPVWYIKALNEGHGYERKENRDVYQQAAMLFLQRYLIGAGDAATNEPAQETGSGRGPHPGPNPESGSR